MKRAIISDIHSNLEGFEAVLADIKQQGITEIYCLGDIIGYGPNPRECIDLVMQCDMCLLATLRSMWQRVGEQARLPTPGQNAKVGVFGAINLANGALLSLCSVRKRSADFISFRTLLTFTSSINSISQASPTVCIAFSLIVFT